MTRNSLKMSPSTIYVINPEILGGQLFTLIERLTKELPDCEFKVMNRINGAHHLSQVSDSSMFLVLNTSHNHISTQQFITKLDFDQRKYVIYPQFQDVVASGYKAANFSELLRYLSQMLIENIGSISQISNNTINKSQKSNVSLHIIIAKSKDQNFRLCVKTLYKRYKSNPSIDFFESKALQKIHTSLFPRILFIINSADIQNYRAGYQTFLSKKSPSGTINTILFVDKSSFSHYGFDYNSIANSQQTLENLLIKQIQNASRLKSSKSLQRNHQSFIQQTGRVSTPDDSETFIFVLDSVDTVYRSFYSQIKSGYQRVNHLNIPFSSKSILIVPSSARDFLGLIKSNPNVKIVLITQQSSPSSNIKSQKGIEFITRNIDELNFYLKKQCSTGGRRLTDVKQIQIPIDIKTNAHERVSITSPSTQRQSIQYTAIVTSLPPSNQRISSHNLANLSKVTQCNLQYTLTQYNQQTNRSIKSQSTTPQIRTTQLILKQTKDNMKQIYQNCIIQQKEQTITAPMPPVSPRTSRKPSISITQQQHFGQYQDEVVQTKNSIKVGDKRSSSSSVEPELSLQSQINASIVRDSLKNQKSRQNDSLITHPSNIVGPRVSMYKQRVSSIGDRRSMMRSTPDEYDIQRRSSRKQNVGISQLQRTSMLNQGKVSQLRSSQYYASGITSPMRSSIMTSPSKFSRPKSSRIAGKLSVIECLANTRSKTLSEMLEKHNQQVKQSSEIDEFQLQFGDQSSLQLVFKTSSKYIQHLSQYFQVYPSTIIRYSDTNQLIDIVPSLNKSAQTILILDSEIVQNIRYFKNFQDFNYIIVCKQQNIGRLKHKFPNTILMKQNSHNKSFKQLLSYIRYLKFKQQEYKISDKQLIPHISAIHSLRIYSPDEPVVDRFVSENLKGFEIINYNSQDQLLNMLENNMFGNTNTMHNIVIVKNAQQSLIQYLVSSVFNIKKIIVYGGEQDLPQLQSELIKISA